LFKSLTYEKDQLEGPAVYYQPGGEVSSKGLYKANVKWGKWLYYKDGKAYKEIDHSTNKVRKLE
jgi:antitoxin component YwqK of YwqJK toxin-antitoxin module